jgi:hypothetical protein
LKTYRAISRSSSKDHPPAPFEISYKLVLSVLQTVSVTVSVLTLTFISVDRWYAICFPLKFKSTTGRAKTAIIIIWLLALVFGKLLSEQKQTVGYLHKMRLLNVFVE